MTKRLLRLLRLAPLALLFAGNASAQTTGTIIGVVTDASTGKPVAGAVVIATSPNLQGEQSAVTDDSGNYRLVQLPPGDYKLAVQLEGYKPFERSDIVMRADRTIRAPLSVVPEAVQMEEQVVRTGAAPVVNVGSAESGAVVSREFMNTVPVGRGFDAVASVVPTAKMNSIIGVGFAGSQAVENQYIIDGLNTTDPAYGGRAGSLGNNGPPSLRSNFTQEIDVKTGNFNAEYGRATGGILNVVLKSGSNEFHGSVFSNYTPDNLFQPDGEIIGSAGEAITAQEKPGEGSYSLDYGFELGGPIMKDRLWFYAGFSPVVTQTAWERALRQNATPANSGGACPAGYELADEDTGVHALGGMCVNANGEFLQTTVPGSARVLKPKRTTYQWVGKLTYLLNENNNVTVTGWGAPSSRTAVNSGLSQGGLLYNARSNELVEIDDQQASVLGRYAGKFLDKRLITEVQAGWYRFGSTNPSVSRAGVQQLQTPTIEWLTPLNVAEFEPVTAGYCTSEAECPVYAYNTGGRAGAIDRTTDRYVAKATASYLLDAFGQHNVKGGVDLEWLRYEVDGFYSGGAAYQFIPTATGGLFAAFRGYGTINLPRDQLSAGAVDGPGIEIAEANPSIVTRQRQVNTSETTSFAYFLQDSWQPAFLPTLTINAGLRLETQSMENITFKTKGFEINDNWAPRVHAIWDFTGTGRGKVAASWGRFYYAMPLDMGNRAFGSDQQLRYNLAPASCGFANNPGTFDPRALDFPNELGTGFRDTTCTLVARGSSSNNRDIRLVGPPLTPVDPNLEGQYVDQFGAQAEYEILPDLSLGIDYQGKRQGTVIEDMAPNGSDYFIGNPGTGRDVTLPDGTLAGNSTTVEWFDAFTNAPVTIKFPEPERSYDGVTLRATKNFSRNWLAVASYTYSVLRGNYSGPFMPEYNGGQLDPGITAEYDLASLMANKTGYLSDDQTHQMKLFGSYTWNFGPRFNVVTSGAYTGISGTPVNALASEGVAGYGSGMSFIIPRAQAGRTPWVHTFDAGIGLGYTVRAPYAISARVDLFNIFNSEEVQEVDSNYTFDDAMPISQLDCKDRDGAEQGNPIAGVQADCPAIKYLKTLDGRPVTVNPNYGKAASTTTAFQAPFSARFSLALSF